MGLFIGMGNPAGDLTHERSAVQEREHDRLIIARLRLQRLPADRAAIQTRRRAGLQAAAAADQLGELFGEPKRRLVANPPSGATLVADMDDSVQEGACGQDGGLRPNLAAIDKNDTRASATLNQKSRNLAPDNPQPLLPGKKALNGGPVERPVCLGPRTLHRRALAPVEKPELDAGPVCRHAHDPVKGINLSHQMALAQSADCRIARHGADGIRAEGDQGRPGTCARRRRRCLGPGVPAPDHDDIEMFHVKHSYFPIQKLAKISPRRASVPIFPTISSRWCMADRSSTATSSA